MLEEELEFNGFNKEKALKIQGTIHDNENIRNLVKKSLDLRNPIQAFFESNLCMILSQKCNMPVDGKHYIVAIRLEGLITPDQEETLYVLNDMYEASNPEKALQAYMHEY